VDGRWYCRCWQCRLGMRRRLTFCQVLDPVVLADQVCACTVHCQGLHLEGSATLLYQYMTQGGLGVLAFLSCAYCPALYHTLCRFLASCKDIPATCRMCCHCKELQLWQLRV
jgi:hypothetical protein